MVPPKENTLRRPPAGMRTVSGRHSGDAHPVRMGAEGAKRGFFRANLSGKRTERRFPVSPRRAWESAISL